MCAGDEGRRTPAAQSELPCEHRLRIEEKGNFLFIFHSSQCTWFQKLYPDHSRLETPFLRVLQVNPRRQPPLQHEPIPHT